MTTYDSIERGGADECEPLRGRLPRTFTLTQLLVACVAVGVCAIGAMTVVNAPALKHGYLSSPDLSIPTTKRVQSLTGDGAVSLTDLITEVTTTGNNTLTLANGSRGQVKIITMAGPPVGAWYQNPLSHRWERSPKGLEGCRITLRLALVSGATITFNDVGDGVVLVYTGWAGWAVAGNNGATVQRLTSYTVTF